MKTEICPEPDGFETAHDATTWILCNYSRAELEMISNAAWNCALEQDCSEKFEQYARRLDLFIRDVPLCAEDVIELATVLKRRLDT